MGVGEEIKGTVKEAAGKLLDKPELEQEGESQKEKGREEREAAMSRAEAKVHDVKADMHETTQEAAQRAK